MEKITKIRVKRPNGTFTDPVPIGAKSVDVTMQDGSTLEQVLGGVDFTTLGSIKSQIQAILTKIGAEEDYAEIGESLAAALRQLKAEIDENDLTINTRVTNVKNAADAKIEAGDTNLKEYVDLLNLNADNKVNLINSTLDNKINTVSNTLDTRVTGLELTSNELDREYSNLTSELKFAELKILTKVDGARVDDQGFLYLLSGEQTIVGPLGPFNGTGGGSGGGGGGGSSSNNAVMTLTNTSGWIAKSIASGAACNISCSWSSIEDETPTGEGIVTVYINGIVRQTIGVNQGEFTVRVGGLLTNGKNSVRVNVTDIYGNTKAINYTVTVVNAVISSTFNTSLPYSGDILFPYVPQGDLPKTVHFVLDGTLIGTQEVTNSGRQITYTIPAQAYGTHSLEVYFIGDMDGVDIESNHLYFEFAAIDAEHNKPIITSNFNITLVEQYSTLAIPYRVYNPTAMTSLVTLKVNGQTLTTINIDRSLQVWSYRCDNAGELVLRIECGEEYKQFTVQVTQSSANIYALTENLVLYLTSNNRNNGELHPDTWTYDEIESTFTNFNFVTDGWQLDSENNTVLRLMGDARLTIPYKLFGSDFKNTGKTIEIEFATKQVADFNTNILSCYADGIGLLITPQQITFKGAQTEISTLYKENEHIRLSIVIGKQNNYRLILIYINGIMSRAVQYASGERFTQLNPVNITIGSNNCDIDLYNIRVYDNDLNRTQILGNWIADTQDSELKLERYNHNNVYDAYGEVTTTKLDLPYMIINADELPQYKGDKKTCSGTYTDPNDSSNSFTFEGCQINVQGTSSSVYFRKNWDLQFKEGFITSNGTVDNYALRKGSIPFNRFVLKADVASSESTNNTGLTMFYNDTCPYKTPEMLENPKVRWGILGIPIVVYWHNTSNDTFEFLGKHNFNLPKRAPAPYGYGNDDTLESWEFERNNSDNVKFKDNDFETMSWDETEQKYFPEWYNDFEARFPSDEWRDYAKLNELISWVKSTYRETATGENLPSPVTYILNSTITVNSYTDDTSYTVVDEMSGGTRTGNYIFTFTKDTPAYRLTKFKAEMPDYFEMESAIFYYLFTEMFTMIDSRAKNMFIGFNGSPVTQSGRIMDRKATCQPYDMDTAVGTNNSGVLMFGFFYEDGDHVSNIISGGDEGSSDAPVFNAQDSVLWSNVRDSCRSELVAMYRNLRASGAWSYEVVETMYENHQSKWCEAIFNEDAYIKYLYPLVEAVTVDEETGRLIRTDRYLTMLQGSKAEQRKWWLYNRFRYMDSKFSTGNASSATLDIRLFNSGTLTITPVNDMYVGVAFGLGTTPDVKRTLSGDPATFTYNAPSGVTEMETSIFSGDMITDLGDLSVFYPNEINFAKGTRLKNLKIGDSAVNYSNTNLRVLDVSNSPLLESIDCRNCPRLASTIDLENSPRLEEAYFDGTSITGVNLADGCVIETLHLPDSITTLTLINLNKLTDLTIDGYENISRLMLTNIDPDILDITEVLEDIRPNSQVNIQGIDLEMNTAQDIADFLDLLDSMQGVSREKSSDGEWLYYEYDLAQVSGLIHTAALTGAEVAEFNRYPYLRVWADHTTSYLTYKTYDDSLTLSTVTCIDGVPQTAAPAIPARADSSDGHYSYTGIGWNTTQNSQTADASAILNVIADRTVYAAYQWNVKTYTVTWKNSNGTTLETDNNVAWGTTPTYNGSTPVDPSGQGSPFVTWTPGISNVIGNITYTASYKPIWTVTFKSQNGSTTLQTKSVIDGNTATYTGTTPTNEDQTTFLGWSNSADSSIADAILTNIKTNKTVYAAFENPEQEITDTWEQIGLAIDNGTYKTRYKVGWYKPLDLGAQGVVNMQIVAMDADTLTAGGTAPLTFIAKEYLATEKGMNTTNTNANGWVATNTMRPYLTNTIMPLIDPLVRMRIQAVDKTYYDYTTTSTLTSSDRLWIPSAREIFGEADGYEDSGVMYTGIYSNANKRKKHSTTSTANSYWWLRSARPDNADLFRRVYNDGSISNNGASFAYGVVIGFCLGAVTPNVTEITDTWDQIIDAIDTNTYKKYDIGQYKPLDLGTEGTINMQIVTMDADELVSGGTAPLTFLGMLLLNTYKSMNPTWSAGQEGTGTLGGWEKCDLRNYLQTTIKPLIPSSVKARLQKVVKIQRAMLAINETTYQQTTIDDLWIPSQGEIASIIDKENSNVSYATVYKDNSSRVKKVNNTNTARWWLRSVLNSDQYFQRISTTGEPESSSFTASYVCLGFCLGTEPETISDDWATIFSNPNYATDYAIGDTKSITINNEPHLMQIVGFDTDDKTSGGKAKISWLMKDLLTTTHEMNIYSTNTDGWPATAMRVWLKDTILPTIDSSIRSHIVDVNKTYYDYTDKTTETSSDNIWLASNREIIVGSSYESSGPGYTTLFNSETARIKKRFGSAYPYWLRTAVYNNAGRFWLISDGGTGSQYNANSDYGVCIGFCTD